jgi:hypothetical protein
MNRKASRWTIVRAFFQGRCQKCGREAPEKNPRNSGCLLHHIDKNEENNDVSNLTLLCKSCHAIVHRNDIKHPRRTNNRVVCPKCSQEGSLFISGRAALIYHGKLGGQKDLSCRLSKVSDRAFLQKYLPQVLTARLVQKYPEVFHEKVKSLKDKGKTYDEIADLLHIGKRTAVTWLKGK